MSDANSHTYLDSLQNSGIRPGLGRMRVLLRALGRPERSCPAIIVAGTNGKGSTSATLASILNQSGYRTGLYTSPHLVRLEERWTIAGREIDPNLLAHSIEELQGAAETVGITPTYFEALTLLAFIAFRSAGCAVVVLEVGMGGRLDATNVVRPLASVITPIGFDHMEYLGTTLRSIAREKAGVIHRGAIALTSNDDPVVLDVLRRRAAQFDTTLIVVEDDHDTPLAGAFQRRNVALAVRAARELMPRLPRITLDSIEKGVAATRWRGRLERMVIADKNVWIDGAHNAHAIRQIVPYIESRVPAPRTLVFGIMQDKDVDDVASLLFPLFTRVIATEPYRPRNTAAGDLVAKAQKLGIAATAEPDPRRAIELALQSSEPSVFIGGSLYLAGAAIELLDARL